MRRFIIAGGVAVLVVVSAWSAAAAPVGARRVSGPTPFAQCADTGGQYYPDAEAEPYITVDPKVSRHLIGIWQQDRYTDGGARGLVSASSWDDGRSWHRALVPFSSCVPGGLNYSRASDPWASVGPDGTVYASGLSFDITSAPPIGGAPNAIGAAVSHDGGRSWQNVRRVTVDSGHAGRSYTDKDSIVADPTATGTGTAYLVWDRVFVNKADTAFHQPAFFSRTTDGGRTWSPARIIAAPGLDESSFNNTILTDPRTGQLYDVFTHGTSTGYSIDMISSPDRGTTWTAPRQVVASYDPVDEVDPNNQNIYVGGSPLVFSAAVDPHSGRIYVAFDTGRFSAYSYDDIAVTSSARRGHRWTTPAMANSPTGRAAFLPAIAVDRNGVLALSYNDLRSLQPTNSHTLPTDRWLRTSTDRGVTFGADQHLAGPFNYTAAPNLTPGEPYTVHFLGDYQGLTASSNGFTALFAATNCLRQCTRNPDDIYSAWAAPLTSDTKADRDHPTQPDSRLNRQYAQRANRGDDNRHVAR